MALLDTAFEASPSPPSLSGKQEYSVFLSMALILLADLAML